VKQLLLTLLFGMTLAVAGCGGGGDDEKSAGTTTVKTTPATTTVKTTATTHGTFTYPAVVVDNFMQSCTAGKQARRAYCGCTLDKLSENVSVDDFRDIGLSGGKVSQRIQHAIAQAATACADKL
jgi:hypothetical protein